MYSSIVPSSNGSGSGNLRMPRGLGKGLESVGVSFSGCSSVGGLSSPPHEILKAVESSCLFSVVDGACGGGYMGNSVLGGEAEVSDSL